MVVTLKDGSVITLFDAIEAKEIIGEELYNFIEYKIKNSYIEKDEKIHILECENDDLYLENEYMEDTINSIEDLVNDALEELNKIKLKLDEAYIKEELKNLEESLKNIKERVL